MKKKQDEDRWVDVHNDQVMREMGLLRTLSLEPRDKDVWTKTSYERKMLRKYKCSQKDGHFHSSPKKFIPVYGKLIVTLLKNNTFPKTTYSIKCWQHQIPEMLAKFWYSKNGYTASLVAKYSWNGRTYRSTKDLPFWA